MQLLHIRSVLLAAGIVSALAIAATPAQARITPVGNQAGTSGNAVITSSGLSARCPRTDESITVAPDGLTESIAITFGRSGVATCTESLLGTSVVVRCTGALQVAYTASVAGTNASGNLTIPAGITCTADTMALDVSISGPQTARGCVTLSQGPPSVKTYNCAFRDTNGTSVNFSAIVVRTRNVTIS